MLEDNVYANAPGNLTTSGAETNLKLFIDNLGIYLGYTYTDTKQHITEITTTQPLTPKNRISADVTYEVENSFRAGIEGFYNSSQLLNDGTTGQGFWTFGLLVQKMWKHFDISMPKTSPTKSKPTGALFIAERSSTLFSMIYMHRWMVLLLMQV